MPGTMKEILSIQMKFPLAPTKKHGGYVKYAGINGSPLLEIEHVGMDAHDAQEAKLVKARKKPRRFAQTNSIIDELFSGISISTCSHKRTKA